MNRIRKAFTLVELLVVITVMGIITSFIFISVGGSKMRARDTQRAVDLGLLDNAINQYYRDKGSYPSLPDGCDLPTNGVSSDAVTRWTDDSGEINNINSNCLSKTGYIKDLVPNYISALPTDPGPQTFQGGRQIRGYVYFRKFLPAEGIDCYKILVMNPERGELSSYKSLWDPGRDGGGRTETERSIVDNTNIWGWSKYSVGCAAK